MTSAIPPRRSTIGAAMGALVFQLLTSALAGRVSLPGCPESCGNISVPYPFGIAAGCFYEGFYLKCDRTHRPPKLLLGDGLEVLNISLPDGTVRIISKILLSESPEFIGTWSGPPATGPFMVSSRYNWFVSFGATYWRSSPPSTLSLARDTSPPAHVVASTNPSYDKGNIAAFIVEKTWFSMFGVDIDIGPAKSYSSRGSVSTPAISGHQFGLETVPVVLEWSLDSNHRCIGSVTLNYGGIDVRTRCRCPDGYDGNPYLSNGCQDIDECQQPTRYPCHGTCINVPGTYRCSSGKSSRSLPGFIITIIAISAGFGLLFSLLGVTKITSKLKEQRAMKLREKLFKRNHGLLLQQLISSNEDIAEKLKIFSLEELEQATNKFDQNRILGGGGHGTVYKGILSDQRVVAVKKSKIVVQKEIDEFINEVVILSQTNHRNVVKLFGCCLETEVPLLVYEFISNGTLAYHVHGQIEIPLSWKDRLRIALETSRAIAYLHSAASISVFHRDIKCTNILLTDTLTAKVSDFGASRSISIDETGIVTVIQGTHGYLDPEYYYTSRLTEKSDVYSFGVILAELLTRVKPLFHSELSELTSLASYFMLMLRDNRLSDILDPQIVEEGGTEEAEVVARLAEACLSLKGDDRPTMRQVETTLEDVQGSKVTSQIIMIRKNAPNDQSYMGSEGGEGTRQNSLEKEFIHSSEIPR
ncbi:hypothetical protein PR202_gb14121 [Eleusine coracana subsp. coracana]|uniref:Protein kinase domain-containing protein n=1 Tax=Eleusine coracana subsp. coracana TaxID=191504 RepID=A0AAV5ETT6_ELECO|nr:hypothetical protein PR202_gb14121 [Eleusine coracana subsp. coracana]